jgi:hypothetical protein
MKKIFIFFAIMFMSLPSYSSNNFIMEGKEKDWHITLKLINDNIILKSIAPITEKDISAFKAIYLKVKTKYFEYANINSITCKNKQLEIRIVTEQILDNRKYFPNEDTYATSGTIIFGRYFQYSNILYIVPPDFEKYYWENNFAHELLHYFRDDCELVRETNNLKEHEIINISEHKIINKFLNKYFPEK